MTRKLLAAVICSVLTAFGLVAFGGSALADPLRSLASARGLIMGTAVDTNPLGNEAAYRTTLNREFNGVTPENAMKWDATEPNQNQFNFTGADQVVNSAMANGQTIHGHTMVWHQQTPGWVQGLGATQMRAALQNHINTVMGRYAGKIESWDVVNEAFNDDGTRRASFWQNTLGANYIADAFTMARAADPAAKLCYNDFNIEGVNAKSTAVFNLLSSFKQQGVPIDCLGIQGHLSIDFSFPGQVLQNLQRFAGLGIDVKFTELDVRMTLPTSAAKLSTQATFYTNVVNACLAVPRCNQITIWGFTDKFSWVPGTFSGQGAALPFDENYNPKPAYNAINTALGGAPSNDTTPPTQPGTPTAANVTSNSAALSWAASTDTGGSGLAGYNIYRRQGTTDTQLATSTTNSAALTGLSPSTQYIVVIRARDGAGNLSTPSNTVTFTTQAGPGGGAPCQVAYSAMNWGGGGGFTANIVLTNTGTSAINGWTLSFTYAADQRLTPPGWSATWTQAAGSSTVTATNLDWNRTLNANGGNATFGFNGTFGSTNPAPTAFTLNGTACTTA